MTALLVGFGLGIFVGAQPGPVSLLCVRSVLRGAFASGIAIGAGAAVVDLLYAALGLAGVASLLEIDALRIGLGVFGALVLAVIGARTLWAAFRVRLGAEAPDEVATPRRAFATAVAAAANRLTIATGRRAPRPAPHCCWAAWGWARSLRSARSAPWSRWCVRASDPGYSRRSTWWPAPAFWGSPGCSDGEPRTTPDGRRPRVS